MVAKCANPACSERFLRLHQGKLFRWDGVNAQQRLTRSSGPDARKARKVEFFWLCGDCAREMTIVFDPEVGVATRALAASDQAAKEGATASARRGTPPAGHSSESAASPQTYVFRRAAG
jgi:hypothetical protein